MYDIVLAFITAFSLTYLAIPSIISVSNKKRLFDEPGERTSHTVSTPSLGGIGIFAGTIFSIIMWTPFKYFADLQYILCSFIIIFLIGAKDDIDPLSPGKKFMGQIFAAAIIVFKAKIYISSFYGIFGITDLPFWFSALFSIFIIVLIINAFNLIDGINGLSGSIGVLITTTFGFWFYKSDYIEFAMVAFALGGSLVAFLKYNYSPAEIFMGDTGSLLLGLVASILAIQFMELNNAAEKPDWHFKSAPAAAVGVLILPLFDTLSVFTRRIINGRSPFHPDKTHIHHQLLDLGLSHMQATYVLVAVNLAIILPLIYLDRFGPYKLLFILTVVSLALATLLYYLSKRAKLSKQ